MKTVFVSLMLLCVLSGCATFVNRKSVVGVGDYDLHESELADARRKAVNGDAEAALRLYYYYAFYMNDQVAGIVWLKKAAALGDFKAIDILRAIEGMQKAAPSVPAAPNQPTAE